MLLENMNLMPRRYMFAIDEPSFGQKQQGREATGTTLLWWRLNEARRGGVIPRGLLFDPAMEIGANRHATHEGRYFDMLNFSLCQNTISK